MSDTTMSETLMGDTTASPVPSAFERLAPFVVPRRDRVLPILVWASLIVHATIFLPSLFQHDQHDAARQEIPVELVQLPPKPTPAPAPKPPPPHARQAAQKPAPKPQPKPQATPKPPEEKVAQKPAPKPEPKPQPHQPSGEERMKQLLGPMPAIALPGAAANGDDVVDYSQLVLSKVAKAKKQGRYSGVPGASSVAFSIGDAGEVINVRTVRPSGDASLDEEAIAMVKRGAPYPPPPPGGRRDYAITLRFQAL